MTDSPPDPQNRRQAAGEPAEPVPEAAAADPGDGVRLEVSGTQVAASVLASVSAAVVASFFGVAGTIIGAGVVSVVATIGSAAYSLGIRRTKHRLHKLQTLRITRPLPSVRTEDGKPGPAVPVATDPEPVGTTDPEDAAGWRGWLAERRWGVAAGVALVFVISLASVTLLELVGDRTLGNESSGSARTSIGALLFGDGGSDEDTDGGTDDAEDEDDSDDGGGADPVGPSTTVPNDTTTTSQPGATTSTTAVEPGTGTREPPAPSTSTTSPTSTTAPSVAPTTTVPDGQAAPPPADLGGDVTPVG